MKILWLCNFPTPEIARKIGVESIVNEGWIQGLSEELLNLNGSLIYFFPQNISKEVIGGEIGRIEYYGFSQQVNYNEKVKQLTFLLRKIEPDIIHLMGTEYAHSSAMIDACTQASMLDKTVVSIQGMPSVYWKHYLEGVPEYIRRRKRLKDIIFKFSLYQQQNQMKKRGESELHVLKCVYNVFGRTDWDKACTMQINPKRLYLHCGEILRKCFYTGEWNVEKIERHSVFFSQATNPIKGLHFAIEAINILSPKYSDVKLYVGGKDIYSGDLWKKSSYEKYIRDMIHKYNLENKVIFLGALQAEQMKEHYLNSNVFVSASTIENSPNSVGEAMILGVPTITSDVGGVKEMLVHGMEGYIYPMDEPYMLAYYIDMIFSDDALATKLGKAAKKRAVKNHDRESVAKELMKNYNTIINRSKINEYGNV